MSDKTPWKDIAIWSLVYLLCVALCLSLHTLVIYLVCHKVVLWQLLLVFVALMLICVIYELRRTRELDRLPDATDDPNYERVTRQLPGLIAAHPVLPVQDIRKTVLFYMKLGFAPLFVDSDDDPRYAGIGRDGVEIHLQWHDPAGWASVDRPQLRFLVHDVDALYEQFKATGAVPEGKTVRDTEWGTREFGFFDPDKNGLTFYCSL